MTPRAAALCLLALASFSLTGKSPLCGQSSLPGWWTDPSTAIIDPEAVENNFAPVNLGQLKHVATMAQIYFSKGLAAIGGSGSEIDALVNAFESTSSANYSPVNLGQVKAVAKPYYDRLNEIGYDVSGNLIARGYPSMWSHGYPWNPATPASQNYAPINVGQLKMVFSFNLNKFDVFSVDTNNSGLPDWWQLHFFGQINLDPDQYPGDPSDGSYRDLYEAWKAQGDEPESMNSLGLVIFNP